MKRLHRHRHGRLSVHDGDETSLSPVLAWALVEFENGEAAVVDLTIEWGGLGEPGKPMIGSGRL